MQKLYRMAKIEIASRKIRPLSHASISKLRNTPLYRQRSLKRSSFLLPLLLLTNLKKVLHAQVAAATTVAPEATTLGGFGVPRFTVSTTPATTMTTTSSATAAAPTSKQPLGVSSCANIVATATRATSVSSSSSASVDAENSSSEHSRKFLRRPSLPCLSSGGGATVLSPTPLASRARINNFASTMIHQHGNFSNNSASSSTSVAAVVLASSPSSSTSSMSASRARQKSPNLDRIAFNFKFLNCKNPIFEPSSDRFLINDEWGSNWSSQRKIRRQLIRFPRRRRATTPKHHHESSPHLQPQLSQQQQQQRATTRRGDRRNNSPGADDESENVSCSHDESESVDQR